MSGRENGHEPSGLILEKFKGDYGHLKVHPGGSELSPHFKGAE